MVIGRSQFGLLYSEERARLAAIYTEGPPDYHHYSLEPVTKPLAAGSPQPSGGLVAIGLLGTKVS